MHLNGYSIQCRVTTEDPANNFAPDTGKLTAYRTSGGFGVRLDSSTAGAGSVISPYYDSLLVKVTTWDTTFEGVCRKALRAIREVHVRGVKTNVAFISNILTHPRFLDGTCHTKFIDDTPKLFELRTSQDRATKMLKYIANIVVKEKTTTSSMRRRASRRYTALREPASSRCSTKRVRRPCATGRSRRKSS